tara:strand:+ start:788 stop:1423 length:636 start_codon:yes stop_codon:yes gene_type:complete
MSFFVGNSRFPKAPKTPLFVCYMELAEVIPPAYFLTGVLEHTPRIGEIFAFIPYLDLPYYALDEEKAIAFITNTGKRGWLSKDNIDTFFEDRNHYLIDSEMPSYVLESFEKRFAEGGWETTIQLWKDINWEQHFRLRTDDGDIDLIPIEWFREYPHVDVCGFCGHTNPKRFLNRDIECEACNFNPKRDETVVESQSENNSTFDEQFSDKWG